MARGKRIKQRKIRILTSSPLLEYPASQNRLVEVVPHTHYFNDGRFYILCQKCAKKVVEDSHAQLNKSIYKRSGYDTDANRWTTAWNVLRYGRYVGKFEKLQCENCGKRNEP